jgi:hypothetical protein
MTGVVESSDRPRELAAQQLDYGKLHVIVGILSHVVLATKRG